MTPAFRAALVLVDGKEKTPKGAKALIGAQLVLCLRNPWRLQDLLPPRRVLGGFGARKKIGRRDETLPRGLGLSVTESGGAQSPWSREEGGARAANWAGARSLGRLWERGGGECWAERGKGEVFFSFF